MRRIRIRHPVGTTFVTATLSLLITVSTQAQGSEDLKLFQVDEGRSSIVAATEAAEADADSNSKRTNARHALLATEWDAEICAKANMTSSSGISFEKGVVTVDSDSLEIDTHKGRRAAGLPPGDGLDEHESRELKNKLMGRRFFAADTYPQVRLETIEIEPKREVDSDEILVKAYFRFRYLTRIVTFPMRVDRNDDGTVRLFGWTRVNMRAYRWRGYVKDVYAGFADRILIRYELNGSLTDRPCPNSPDDRKAG